MLAHRRHEWVVGRTMDELGLLAGPRDESLLRMLRERRPIDGIGGCVSTPSGETTNLRLRAEIVPDEDGWLAVVRASAETDGAASATRAHPLREGGVYRSLVERIPAVTYVQAADASSPTGFRHLFVSPQATRILGRTPEELIANPGLWSNMALPEDRGMLLAEDPKVSTGARRFQAEYRLLARDGRVVWCHDEAVLVDDPDSDRPFWQGVIVDVTAQKQADIRHAGIGSYSLVEQIPAVVYIRKHGEDREWFYISPQLEQVLGHTPEEWLAHPHPLQSLVHPDDIGAVVAEELRSRREGDALRVEYRIESKDGRWVWILDEATAVRNELGETPVLQGVMFDVTERKRAEFELASANEQLRALDRHKNTLLHTLSHDLRQPISAILGTAATLESLHLPEPERKSLLQRLQTRARGMDELLTDLLDFDRLDRGITEPRRGPVDLRKLIDDLVSRYDCLEGRQLEIECQPLVVAADRAKLATVLENLIQNATRHTPEGSTIWVRALKQEGGALVCVDDDGPGVPDELKESVFEPLRRGPNASDVPGSGLGLSLVARFSELHGGRAWVEDRPGGGASFRVFLPDVRASVS
ncbi:MAG TPA: PAS domain-containing sensor histidine kinase [Actinomycetota bacterium]